MNVCFTYKGGDSSDAYDGDTIKIVTFHTNNKTFSNQLIPFHYALDNQYTTVGKIMYIKPAFADKFPYIFRFDLSNLSLNGTWQKTGGEANKRRYTFACLTSTKQQLFVIGGDDSNDVGQVFARNSVLMYDFDTQWTKLANLTQARYAAACIVHNNQLYAIGGRKTNEDGSVASLLSIETMNMSSSIYPSQWTWKNASFPLIGKVDNSKAIAHGDDIILIGGGNQNQVIHTKAKKVTPFPAFEKPFQKQYGQGVIKVDNTIYVFGGAIDDGDGNTKYSNTIQTYTFKLRQYFIFLNQCTIFLILFLERHHQPVSQRDRQQQQQQHQQHQQQQHQQQQQPQTLQYLMEHHLLYSVLPITVGMDYQIWN